MQVPKLERMSKKEWLAAGGRPAVPTGQVIKNGRDLTNLMETAGELLKEWRKQVRRKKRTISNRARSVVHQF